MCQIVSLITKYIFRVYCLAAIILLSFEISAQNVDETYSSQLQELYDIKEDIRKKSSIILHIAKNTNEASFNDQYTSREYVLISSANCQVYESQFDTEYPIFSPNINDELLILSEDDNWFEIKLKDGRNAWIEESCGQKTIRSEKKKVGRLKSINNKNDQIQLASFVMEEIKILSIEAEKKSKKIRENKRSTPQDLEQLSSLNGQINKFKSLTESAYIQYLVPELDAVNYLNLLDKFSFLGELQLGASDFSMVFGENSKISQKGLIGDFLMDLTYKLNNQSQANFTLSNTNDIIQTPFTNTLIEAGYKSAFRKLKFNSAISLNRYDDKFNAFNKYNRIGFQLGANQKLGNKSTINLNYLLHANNYSLFEGINFSNHSINLATNSVLSASRSLNVNLRANVQAGQEERRNFILFFPELKYNIRKQNATNQYFFSYQKYSFNNLELRDTDRLMLGIRNSKRGTSKSSNRYLGLSAKLFQNKPTFNYYQLDTRLSSNWTKNKSFFTSSAFRINYYPLQNNLNYTDLQFSLGSNGSLFYNFSSFNRFYYSTEDLTNALDLNLRAGLSYKSFRFGPSLSMHSLLNLNNTNFVQDGNFYRLGAFAEGNIMLPYQINISLISAYDYGFVYSQQFSQNASTGEISIGDVNERHPTTFQFNTTITTSFVDNTDLFLRINMYIIDTDLSAAISRSPVDQNTRFTVRLGVRYRFN